MAVFRSPFRSTPRGTFRAGFAGLGASPAALEWITTGQKTSTKTSAPAGAAFTIDAPDDIAEGDLLVLVAGAPNESFDLEAGLPSGFSLAAEAGNLPIATGFDPIIQVAIKVATASEPANYTFTPGGTEDRHCAVIARVTGAAVVGASDSFYTSGGTVATAPSVTPVASSSLLVSAFTGRTSGDISAFPAGMTEVANIDTAGSFPPYLGVAVESRSDGSATGTREWTGSLSTELTAINFTLEAS